MHASEMFLTHAERSRNRAGSAMLSLAIHGGAAALLFTVTPPDAVERAARHTVKLVEPLVAPYLPARPARTRDAGGGGGGGGDNSVLPPSRGALPRLAPRQFTPPAAVAHNEAPKLLMEPTIVVAPDAPLPHARMAIFGDPLAKIGPPSSGPGSGGGIGTGAGGGIGSGKGPGYGPGEGGGLGGGMRGGRGFLTAAQVLYQIEPEYSDEARKAKVQGTVSVLIDIDERGRPTNPRLRGTLGLGLDEKAVEAVMKWRFRPYMRDGKPVAGPALVEVRFRLL